MQRGLSLMWERRGREPDTWGHFHFLCQLWQTAISTAEENISRSSRSHPFTLSNNMLFCQSWKSVSLAWWGWKWHQMAFLYLLHGVSKTCCVMKGVENAVQIQNMIRFFFFSLFFLLCQSKLHQSLGSKLSWNFSTGRIQQFIKRNTTQESLCGVLESYQLLKLSVWAESLLVLWYSDIGSLVSSNPH